MGKVLIHFCQHFESLWKVSCMLYLEASMGGP